MKESYKKILCSVSILTFNSGDSLSKCLESVKQFSEIIICDGGSTDDTLEIAKRYGCKIILQDLMFKHEDNKIADFSGVRNQTLLAAINKWFLYVDSDEFLTPEVVDEIRLIVENDSLERPKVYDMPRKFFINNLVIDCASAYPNYHTRLFHLDYVRQFTKEVHEKILIKDTVKKSRLINHTIVPIEEDYFDMVKKHLYYLDIEKKRCSEFNKFQLLHSTLRNIRSFIIRVLKIIKNSFFCRGNKMPINIELAAARYSLKLIVILLSLLFRLNK